MEKSAKGGGAEQSNGRSSSSSRGQSTSQGRGRGKGRGGRGGGGASRGGRSGSREGAGGGGRRAQIPAPTPQPPKPSEAPANSKLAERLIAAGKCPQQNGREPRVFDAAVGSQRKRGSSVGNGGAIPSTNGHHEQLVPQRRFGISSVDVPLESQMEGAVGGALPQEVRNGFLERNQMCDPNYSYYLDYATTHNGFPWERPSSPWLNKVLPGESISLAFNSLRLVDRLQTGQNSMMMEHIHGNRQISEEAFRKCPPESRQVARNGHSREMGTPPQAPPLTFTSFPTNVTIDPIGMVPKPTVFVFPQRAINFTNELVQFSCQVFNIPQSFTLHPRMFDAMAETPSGRIIHCQIRRVSPTGAGGRYALETFLGSFMASEEIGVYFLKVRLVLPFRPLEFAAHNFADVGVTSDTVDILISRNYYKQSKMTGYSLQLEFLPYENGNGCLEGEVVPPSKAWGLACDKKTNRIYFSDRSGNRVSCMDPRTGQILFHFDQTRKESHFNRPTGLCCDEFNRRVMVCDKDNHRICMFTIDGQFITSFGSQGIFNGMFTYPWDVDVNRDGSRIVVTDSRNKRIQLFDRYGNYQNKFTVLENNPLEHKKTLDYPRGISFDADGQLLYVTDFISQNVIMVPIDFVGSRRLIQEGKLARPQGIAVDAVGGFIVADSRNNCLFHCAGDGQILSTIKSIGKNAIQYPVNVTLMQDGYVAMVDGSGKMSIF